MDAAGFSLVAQASERSIHRMLLLNQAFKKTHTELHSALQNMSKRQQEEEGEMKTLEEEDGHNLGFTMIKMSPYTTPLGCTESFYCLL